jgi:rare lipoprotein A
MRERRPYSAIGMASWYGTMFHAHRTSNGERYNMLAMTAAHRSLPLPTYLRVTNLENGRRVIVRVNDRGPFKYGRLIDLSYAAAAKLGMAGKGTALVEIKTILPGYRAKTKGRRYVDNRQHRLQTRKRTRI